MTPSPVEALALAYVEHHRELADLMRGQFAKGHAEYGHSIDHWPAKTPERIREAQKELLDSIVYLTAIDPHRFTIDCHRLASICVSLSRYGDLEANDPMRSVKGRP